MPKKSNTKRADGRYSVQIYVGMINGKRKYKTVYGKTQKEANQKAEEIKVALKKVKEICSSYNNECKKDCEFNVDGICIFADDPSDFELDNLFKD